MPHPYRPGGAVQIRPPDQQQIQAPIAGQITAVYAAGGDGQWLPAGTVIATLVSPTLQTEIATLQENIRQQQAQIAIQQAELAQLQGGPRPQAVEVQQRQVAVARQTVAEAQTQLEATQATLTILQQQVAAAQVHHSFSVQEVARLEQLYAQGAYALQSVEAARETAEIARLRVAELQAQFQQAQKQVETARQTLAIRQRQQETSEAELALVLSGAAPEATQAAQQAVAAAEAQLRALQQNLRHAQGRLQETQLVMPIDGYLVEPYLEQRLGSYLNPGDLFATVQQDEAAIAELQVPEYDSGELTVGAPAQVKLLAYPNQPLSGTVISVEPTATEETYGRILNVLIQLEPQATHQVRAGMSGYAKIAAGEKPLLVLLTRPIVRFVQIELWSWLP